MRDVDVAAIRSELTKAGSLAASPTTAMSRIAVALSKLRGRMRLSFACRGPNDSVVTAPYASRMIDS